MYIKPLFPHIIPHGLSQSKLSYLQSIAIYISISIHMSMFIYSYIYSYLNDENVVNLI